MIASTQRLEDYIEKNKQRLITASSNNTNNIRTDRKITIRGENRKKNNCTNISSDKQGKSLTRKSGHGYEKETLRETLNLF